MYEISKRICDLIDGDSTLSDSKLADYLGINKSSVSQWRNQKSEPKSRFIADIANYLSVSPKYLLTGEELTDTEEYAERLHRDPSLRILFDAAGGASPEDLQLAAEMLKKMKKSSGYDD